MNIEVSLGGNLAKISPDDLQITFQEFWNQIPMDCDSLIKTYLFRGWYITELTGGNLPKIDECPCCFRPFKNDP